MDQKDFYNIKDLGKLSDEDGKSPAPYQASAQKYKNKSKHRQHTGRRTWIIIAVIIVVILLGAGVAWLVRDHKKAAPPHQAVAAQSKPPRPASITSSGATTYTAAGSDLNLTFDYPSDWTVSPASGSDTTNQTITATSPLATIMSAAGSSVTGKVTVSVRSGSTTISELNTNNPTAAQTSAQFAYSAPTSVQYQYPYLTFIHFSTGSTVVGAFEEVIVTGTTPFMKGDAVTAADLSGLDPIISAVFTQCATEACSGSNATPLSITNTTWTSAELFKQTQTLLASFKLN